MTENDHFIGRIEDYLVEFDGATPLPDRVIDAIHAELPRTRQVKASPGLMRMPAMLTTISSRAPWGPAALAKVGVTTVAVVAIGVVGLTFLRPPSVGPAADLGIFAPVSGRLVYSENSSLWAVDPNASSPASTATRLGMDDQLASGTVPLAWSSDGSKLLLLRDDLTDQELFRPDYLYILHADGTETQLNKDPMHMSGATIAPDGSRVAFAAGAYRGPPSLFVVDADGGEPARIALEAYSPTFSPDGTQIAYLVIGEGGVGSVRVAKADGSDAREILVNEPALVEGVFDLAWSPAGDRIAIENSLEGHLAIYTVAPDGTNFRKVITDGINPFWSPDGSQIAYMLPYGEPLGGRTPGLAIADADGSNVREFGFGASGPWHPGSPIDDAPPTPAETSKSVETPPSQTLPPSPLTERFDSTLNGISIDYPTGWQTRPATEPWTGGELHFESSAADVIFDPALGDRVYVALASLPTEGEIDVEGFVAGFCRGMGGEMWSVFGGVGGVPAQGRSCGNNGRTYITVEPLGRSYLILKVVASDEPGLAERFNWNWFEPMLESVTLRPNAAVQGASPSASP